MKLIELADAEATLRKCIQASYEEPVIFVDQGTPVASLTPLPNTDLESVKLSYDPAFLRIIEDSRRSMKDEDGISTEGMRHRLGLSAKRRPAKRGGS